MADDKKEPWVNWLAISTVVFAVCATLSTFKGGGFSTSRMIFQAQASDQWAYYQAKNIRENLYRVQVENIQLQLDTIPRSASPELRQHVLKALADAQAAVTKYETEKKDIQKEAKALEAKRDEAQLHGTPFGIAVIFLQVAILLSSIAGLLKRRWLWLLALPVGAAGILCFADGFLLFLPASIF